MLSLEHHDNGFNAVLFAQPRDLVLIVELTKQILENGQSLLFHNFSDSLFLVRPRLEGFLLQFNELRKLVFWFTCPHF